MNKELEKINNEQLQLISKVQEYIQYMLEILIKLPRIEKFSIGNEYKCSMYKLLEYILYVSKIEKEKRLEYINKNILYRILKKKIKDEKLLWLINEIVFSNEGIKNLPIGNYTSQMFANIYLNELDQYIKHKLCCKYYYRYMDDGIILIKTKEQAKEILENIKIFLKQNLELELNKKTQIFKSKPISKLH